MQTCGLKVAFSGDGIQTMALIIVHPRVAKEGNGLVGLCGNCDGEADDMRTADGTDVSGEPDRYQLISDSYEVSHNLRTYYHLCSIVTSCSG